MRRYSVMSLAALLLALVAPTVRADFDFTFASTPTITAASANPPGTTNTITNGINIGGLPSSTFTSVAPTGTSTATISAT